MRLRARVCVVSEAAHIAFVCRYSVRRQLREAHADRADVLLELQTTLDCERMELEDLPCHPANTQHA